MIDLGRRELLNNDGLIMGRVGDSQTPSLGEALRLLIDPRVGSDLACRAVLGVFFRGAGRMIRVRDHVHLLTCAPAGAGKTVFVLGPNLLSYRGSCVVTDPKGELVLLTLEQRRDRFGHRCFVFDPFEILKENGIRSASFNPLDFIDASSPAFLSQCKDLANMLVVRTGEEKEPHWNDSAELILTSIIAFVCACEPDRKLRTLTDRKTAGQFASKVYPGNQGDAAGAGILERRLRSRAHVPVVRGKGTRLGYDDRGAAYGMDG